MGKASDRFHSRIGIILHLKTVNQINIISFCLGKRDTGSGPLYPWLWVLVKYSNCKIQPTSWPCHDTIKSAKSKGRLPFAKLPNWYWFLYLAACNAMTKIHNTPEAAATSNTTVNGELLKVSVLCHLIPFYAIVCNYMSLASGLIDHFVTQMWYQKSSNVNFLDTILQNEESHIFTYNINYAQLCL